MNSIHPAAKGVHCLADQQQKQAHVDVQGNAELGHIASLVGNEAIVPGHETKILLRVFQAGGEGA